jgi:hypothetical protein
LEELVGTAITLEVGGVDLTYSKNHLGIDHGSLFQKSDRKPIRSDQIDYAYFEAEGEDPTPMEMAFVRPLKDVTPRLELLGFTLDRVRREYESVTEDWREQLRSSSDEGAEQVVDLMSFTEFRDLATAYPLESLDSTYRDGTDKDSIRRIHGRFSKVEVDRIPHYLTHANPAYSERSFFAGLIDILHPYSVIRLLAEAEANEDAPVIWQYGPLVDAGWANVEEFTPEARRSETFLIATEGSSDVHILGHALALLRPSVADFFRFIDVTESHPFSGTGNLAKFAEGLAKIDVQNQVLFLFDNDAEGLDAYQRLLKLTLPINMRATMLPELGVFRTFPAQGPEGVQLTDINRRAAAIECYLDLRIGDYAPPKVLWTNFKKSLGIYHGALEYKESYVNEFLSQTPETIRAGSYDVSKIEAVLDLLITECTGIAFDQGKLAMSKTENHL